MVFNCRQIIVAIINCGSSINATFSNAYKDNECTLKVYNIFSKSHVVLDCQLEVINAYQIIDKCNGISKGYPLLKFVNAKPIYMELYRYFKKRLVLF